MFVFGLLLLFSGNNPDITSGGGGGVGATSANKYTCCSYSLQNLYVLFTPNFSIKVEKNKTKLLFIFI